MKVEEYKEYHLLKDKFPRIAESVRVLQGTPELSKYFNKLMFDTRDGARTGFPTEVASAIFSLSMENDTYRLVSQSPWEENNKIY